MTCPKCGSDRGWSGPKYRSERFQTYPGQYVQGVERLEFTCETCGYTRDEPVRDAPVQAEAKG